MLKSKRAKCILSYPPHLFLYSRTTICDHRILNASITVALFIFKMLGGQSITLIFSLKMSTFWKPTVQSLQSPAHKIYVTRLYRRSLKLAQDWYWRREEFREKALIIRGHFEAGRNITNLKEAEEALGHTEHLLAVYRHPQPFTCKLVVGIFQLIRLTRYQFTWWN
jgi:hypothetical protein